MFGWVPENAQEIIFKCLFLSKMKKNKIQNFSSEPSTQTQGPQNIYIYIYIQKQSIWMINIRKFSTKYANTIQDNKLLSRN